MESSPPLLNQSVFSVMSAFRSNWWRVGSVGGGLGRGEVWAEGIRGGGLGSLLIVGRGFSG